MVYMYVLIGFVVSGYMLGQITKKIKIDSDVSAAWVGLIAVVSGFIWPLWVLLVLLACLGRFGQYVNQKLEQ